MAEESLGYKTDYPQAREIIDWPSRFTFVKVTSIEHLKTIRDAYFEAGAPIIAFDTETSSLSIIDLEIVGLSFCWDIGKTKTAYYVPLGHKVGDENLPIHETLEILDSMLGSAERVLVYNLPFDMRVLRKYSLSTWRYKLLDVMCLVWNVDTNVKRINLKDMSFYHVGFKMVKYMELIKKLQKGNLTLTPGAEREDDEEEEDSDEEGNLCFFAPVKEVVDYACSDAVCTFFLFLRFLKFFNENCFIVEMDSMFEKVKMHLEETPVYFDKQRAVALEVNEVDMQQHLHAEILQLAGEEFRAGIREKTGKDFNLNSGPQLVSLFGKLHIPLTERTKGTKKNPEGNVCVNEAVLSKLAKQYRVAAAIIEYRKHTKAISTYITKFTQNKEDFGFFKYLTHQNPTGRLQGSGKERKGYGTPIFMPMNIQNIPKPEPGYFIPEKLSDLDSGVLGWNFRLVGKDEKETVEGYKPNNIRETFIPHEGHVVFSADYSGQELVIIANLSKDPAFLNPFKNGEDLHKKTAIDMFGESNYDKEKRRIAKTGNFNCVYLGNEFSMQQNLGDIPLEKVKIYYDLWKRSHKAYFDWLETRYQEAKRNGYVKSALGRHRRVAYWFNSPNWKEEFFGKKTVSNSPIQGLGGDIIRFVLIRIFNEVILNPKYEGKVYFMMTVHDEINFSIDRRPEYFYEIANKLLDIMTDLPFNREPFNWEVPLTASPSVGYSWGSLIPFKVKSRELWIPKIG